MTDKPWCGHCDAQSRMTPHQRHGYTPCACSPWKRGELADDVAYPWKSHIAKWVPKPSQGRSGETT